MGRFHGVMFLSSCCFSWLRYCIGVAGLAGYSVYSDLHIGCVFGAFLVALLVMIPVPGFLSSRCFCSWVLLLLCALARNMAFSLDVGP